MNSPAPLRLALLIASTREGRFAPVIARWFESRIARRSDIAVDVVDLAQTRLPEALGNNPPPSVAALASRLAAADAFVVLTPEYNHSFPAPLKTAIDWYREEWEKKPVAFVSYGGISGGLRAVEQLRQIFAELQAVTVKTTVSFHRAHAEFDASGNPVDAPRIERCTNAMLNEVAWWGTLLREARARDGARFG